MGEDKVYTIPLKMIEQVEETFSGVPVLGVDGYLGSLIDVEQSGEGDCRHFQESCHF